MGLIVTDSGRVIKRPGFENPINNFDRVDDKVFRGAQPDATGIDMLKVAGVTDIICLREDDYWKEEPAYCKDLEITFHHVPFNPFLVPTRESLKTCLDIIEKAKGRVFIHCQYGRDRTGTVVAIYRIMKGAPNSVALSDAIKHGLSDWEIGMRELIECFKPENL